MQPRSVAASHAIEWLKAGWRAFITNPVMWVVLTVLWLVLAAVLELIPLLGGLIMTLITPALLAGLIYAARESSTAQPVVVTHLFQGLTDARRRGPLLVLGVILLVTSLALTLVAAGVFAGLYGLEEVADLDKQMTPITPGLGAIALLALVLALGLAVFALIIYAIPLVMFTDLPPVPAVKSSLQASLRNISPLVVFSLIYLLLSVLAAIPMGLGFLVLIPVSVGALYASYRDIYPEDDTQK
jgi:uncharacterized membrane protein